MKIATKKEIIDFKKVYLRILDYYRELKKENEIAKYIKNPQIPSYISESLGFHLLKEKNIIPEIGNCKLQLTANNAPQDVIVINEEKRITVEIKATGVSGFQRLNEGALAANFILWVHFNDYFSNEEKNEIYLYIIKEPSKYFPGRTKVPIKVYQVEELDPKVEKIKINLTSFLEEK